MFDLVRDTGYNIEDANTCALNGVGDQFDTDPLLDVLADNGGPTRTHHLLSGSPAIDSGGNNCLPTDQRGVSRPQDGNVDSVAVCDIGAVEYTAVASVTLSPASIDFGAIAIDASTSPRTIIVSNTGIGVLSVNSIALSGTNAADFKIDPGDGAGGSCGSPPVALAALANCTVAVEFSPSAHGVRNAQLDVTTNAGVGVTTLSGSGFAEPRPNILVLHDEIDFGTVTADNWREENVYVLNDGGAVLTLGAVGIDDPLAAPFLISADGCSNAELQPGEFCIITVRADPELVPAFLLAGLPMSGLLLAGIVAARRREAGRIWVPWVLIVILAMSLLACGGGGGRGGESEHVDSFDIPSDDPDAAAVTVNVKCTVEQ